MSTEPIHKKPMGVPMCWRYPMSPYNLNARMINTEKNRWPPKSRRLYPVRYCPPPAQPQPSPTPIPKVSMKQEKKTEEKKCWNCETTNTSVWRRFDEKLVCNACKLHYRNHKTHRPIAKRTDEVKTRKRRSQKKADDDDEEDDDAAEDPEDEAMESDNEEDEE